MHPYQNPDCPIEERVSDLLSRMTTTEKVAQTLQFTIGKDTTPNNIGADHPFDPRVGSILSFYGGVTERNAYQKLAIEGTRLGIPIIWGADVIHGWQTIFPAAIAQASSFDPELTRQISRISAAEAWYGGVDWTFSPMVEVCHDPRWGRVVEGYGEDPTVAGKFAAAAVKGYQEPTPEHPETIAACLKHYVGYSASEAGHDYAYTDISLRALHEWYLPPFEAGVRAGTQTVMSSFNDINGTPAVVNRGLLTGILRECWGFRGFVVSDWESIKQLEAQGFSAEPLRQAIAALSAGNDMDMVDGIYRHLETAVESGRLEMRYLNLAVERILRVKFELGLFEHPYTEERDSTTVWQLPEYLDFARRSAADTMVLLKNENDLLPLVPERYRRIALIGPAANNSDALLGSWLALAATGRKPVRAETYRDVIADYFPEAEIHCAPGCAYRSSPGDEAAIAEAAAVAAWSDVVILAVGEPGDLTGENKSRADLHLPGAQEQLIAAVAATGRPVVMLTGSGRPVIYTGIADQVQSILHVWQGGIMAARATFDLLTGAVTPSARLPMTFPRAVGQVPIYYNRHRRARPESGQYSDLEETPYYEFGHGLSYTTFTYGELRLERRDGRIIIEFTLANTGKRSGSEVVIWFLSDPEAALTQPAKRLISFRKISLAPGASQTVRLELKPERDLSYTDETGQRVFEPGSFIISTGNRSIEFQA